MAEATAIRVRRRVLGERGLGVFIVFSNGLLAKQTGKGSRSAQRPSHGEIKFLAFTRLLAQESHS